MSSNVEFDLEVEQMETVGTTSTHAPTMTTLTPFPNANKADGSVSYLPHDKLSTNFEFETKYITHTESVTVSAPPTTTSVSSTESSKPETESTAASTTMSVMPITDQPGNPVTNSKDDNQKTSASNTDDSKPNIESTTTDGTTMTTSKPEKESKLDDQKPEKESTVSDTSTASVTLATILVNDQTSISATNPKDDNHKPASESNSDDPKPSTELSTISDVTTTTTPKPAIESTGAGTSTTSVTMTTMPITDQPSIPVTNPQAENQNPASESNVDESKPNIESTISDVITTTTPKPEIESKLDDQNPASGSNNDDSKPNIESTITDGTPATVPTTPNVESHAATMAPVSNNQNHFDAGHTDPVTMSPSTEMNNKPDCTTQASASNVLDDIAKNCNATVQESKDKDVPIPIEIDHGDLSPGDSTIIVTTVASEMAIENEAKPEEVTSKQPNILDQIADNCGETTEQCDKNKPIKTGEIDQNVDAITAATSTNEATQASNVMKESVEETVTVSSSLIASTAGSSSNTEAVDGKGHGDVGSTLASNETTTIDPENDSNTLQSSISIVLPLLLAIWISNHFN